MIRILNVYYPKRAVVKLLSELLLVCGSLLLATLYFVGQDAYIALIYEYGLTKILGVAMFTFLLSYYFDLYEPRRISGRWEIYFRLLLVLSVLSFVLAALVFFFPQIEIAPNVLVGGVFILSIALVIWRSVYDWVMRLSLFRERVYVLGAGDRARAVAEALHDRRDAGMDVAACAGEDHFKGFTADLQDISSGHAPIDRVVVAMEDRRGAMPVSELLALRLRGVTIEDSCSLMERLTGKLPLDGLNPSNLIFTEGFNTKTSLAL